jgi:hypothetical protein
MSASDGLKTVHVVELRSDLITKKPASTTRADSPGIDILRVAPDQIAECSLMRNLLCSGNDTDLIDGPDLGAETAVYAEDGAVNNGSQD